MQTCLRQTSIEALPRSRLKYMITCMPLAKEYSGYEVHSNPLRVHDTLQPTTHDLLASIPVHMRNPAHGHICDITLARLAVGLSRARGGVLQGHIERNQRLCYWTEPSPDVRSCCTGFVHRSSCEWLGAQKAQRKTHASGCELFSRLSFSGTLFYRRRRCLSTTCEVERGERYG